jgi:acyl-coenzyme A synthetase/AMP-(fatty) acid ligase
MSKSGTANTALSGAESKVKNVILARWRGIVAEKQATPALLAPDGRVTRTFAALEAEAESLAARFSGLPAGFVASLQAPNHPAWPALLLAIWKSGGCALLVDQTLRDPARTVAERASGACIRLEIEKTGEPRITSLPHAPADFHGFAPDLIKLTSGTTDAPRAVLFTAAQLEADCDQVCETMGIGPNDVNYGIVAFSHSYGFSNLITPLLCRGIPLVAAADALPRAVLAGVASTQATVLPAVPAIFQALAGVEGAMPSLRLCISAGAPLSPSTAQAFRERFGKKVHTFYGASECGGICYDATEDDAEEPGLVGQPLRGVHLERLEGGEVRVRSAAVGLGYFPPEQGNEFADKSFCPADLLEETPAGWRITGRSTDVINVGGKKVSPVEVEHVLLTHPAVREVAVFGANANGRTQSVCACVVLIQEITDAALRSHCAERLAPWQVPRTIIRIDRIPLTARGKINRSELRNEFFGKIS